MGELRRLEYTTLRMGVEATITLYASDSAAGELAASAAFQRISELDSILSDYRDDSELNSLVARAGTGPGSVSRDLARVLSTAEAVRRETAGAVDVTAGRLIRLWRAARRNGQLPDSAAIAAAQRCSSLEAPLLTVDTIHLQAALALCGDGSRPLLDLGAIGKGYALDEAMKVLSANGVTRALLVMGGDMLAGGAPPGTRGWRIQIANADSLHGSELLTQRALSTSGSTEQFAIIDGIRYSHVVDPRTGWALTDGTAATVLAPSSMEADIYSTALTVMSEGQRKALLSRHPDLRAYVRVVSALPP